MARSTALHTIVVCAILVCVQGCASKRPQEAPLTAEAKAYVAHLQLSDVGMKATDSFANQTLTEIEGNVKNTGDRMVNRVEVNCLFYDYSGKQIYQERAAIVKAPLKPGEARRFRLAFDTIPETWNNRMPVLVIAQVIFG